MAVDEKLEQILDAAVMVVNKVGFHKATIDAIAAKAGFSKGGVLHYFKSKNQLFKAIIERYFDRLLKDAYKEFDKLPSRPGRMLKAYIIAWTKHQQPQYRVQVMGLLEDDELRAHLVDYRVDHYTLVLDGMIPEIQVQKVLLICAGLWTTPLLARATMKEIIAFHQVMCDEMLQMIDNESDKCAGLGSAEF